MKRVSLLAATALWVGCSLTGPSEDIPNEGNHPGVVSFHGDTVVALPTTAWAGEPLRIEVVTVGGGALGKARIETRVTFGDRRVTIEPYDVFTHLGPSESAFQPITADVWLTFEEVGVHRLEVVGRGVPGYHPVVVGVDVEVWPPR